MKIESFCGRNHLMNIEDKVNELTSRVITLEAAVKSGCTKAEKEEDGECVYNFLKKLDGEDLIEAQVLIAENQKYKDAIVKQKIQIEELYYRIKHLKIGIDELKK